jgi:septal ring factor EnvC (AmiA/AmiB activator)
MASPTCGQCGHIFRANTVLKDYLDPSTGVLFCQRCWDVWNQQNRAQIPRAGGENARPQTAAPGARRRRRPSQPRTRSGSTELGTHALRRGQENHSGTGTSDMKDTHSTTSSIDLLMAQWPPNTLEPVQTATEQEVDKAEEPAPRKMSAAGHVGRLRMRRVGRGSQQSARPTTAAGRMVTVCEADIESLKQHMKSQSQEMQALHARSEKRAALLARSQQERRALELLLDERKNRTREQQQQQQDDQQSQASGAEMKTAFGSTSKPNSDDEARGEEHWQTKLAALETEMSANKFHLKNSRARLRDSRAECTELRAELDGERQKRVVVVPETSDTCCQTDAEPSPAQASPCDECIAKEQQLVDLRRHLAVASTEARKERERAEEASGVARALEDLIVAAGYRDTPHYRRKLSLDAGSGSSSRRGSSSSTSSSDGRSRRGSREQMTSRIKQRSGMDKPLASGGSQIGAPSRLKHIRLRQRLTTTPNPFNFELDRRFPTQGV